MSLLKTLSFPFFFFVKKLLCLCIIYSSLFKIQSVKMSNKNKYQCYSSWSFQYNRSLPFLIEMLSETEFHLGISPEVWQISCSCQCGLFRGLGHSSQTNAGGRSRGLERVRDAHDVSRSSEGEPPSPGGRAVVLAGPDRGIGTLALWRVTVRVSKLHRVLQSSDKRS